MRRFQISAPTHDDANIVSAHARDATSPLDSATFAPQNFGALDGVSAVDTVNPWRVRPDDAVPSDRTTFRFFAFDSVTSQDAAAITAGSVTAYANGYTYSLAMCVHDQPGNSDTLTNFPLWVDTNDFTNAATAIAPHIKNAAAGGKVVDGTYRDIRFETTSGTQLAHETAIYDGLNGRWAGWILLPSWVVNTKFRFLMYFGKSALGAAEENSAGVWAQAMAAIDPVSGVDGTGRGRSFTPGGVAPTSVTTGDRLVGAYGTSSRLVSGTAAWLDGLGTIAIEFWAKLSSVPTADDIILRVGNATRKLVIRADPTGDYGSTTNTIMFSTVLSDGERFTNLPSSSLDTTDHHYIFSVASGVHKIWRDGAVITPGGSSGTAVGSISTGGDPITIGDPTAISNAGVVGGLSKIIFWPFVPGATWVAMSYLAQSDPVALIGCGGLDSAAVSNRAPIAMPLAVAGTSGTKALCNVVTSAVNPDTGETLTCTAAGPASPSGSVERTTTNVNLTVTTASQAVFRVPYTISDGSKTASSVAIYTISPVISGGVHNGPTITLTYNSTNYTVPAFMKGFEQDPTWTGSGVRFRCPRSKRQFRSGQFNNNNWAAYCGAAIGFHGANLIGYGATDISDPTRAQVLTNTWERIAGGPKDPGTGGVYSDPNTFQATGSKAGVRYYPNNLKGHPNLGAFRSDSNSSTLAVGLYMTTLPFQAATPTDVQNAYSTSATYVDDWYKAFFSRLKDQSTFYDDPVIVIRPNWEAMGQDTGMQLGVGTGLHTAAQWYQAGYTQAQYNAMMRKFCRIGKQYGPPNLYIVFSPAFETTVTQALGKTYESYLTDVSGNGPGSADWVGYTGTCASVHPDARDARAGSEVNARRLISGGSGLPSKYYPAIDAINCAQKYKIPFFSLEIGPSTPYTNASLHDTVVGPKYYGDSFDELGGIVNDPDNYGLIGAFGFLDQGANLIPGSPTATAPGSPPSFWDANDQTNQIRCSKIIRKHFGSKPTYGGDPIPARV